jgi:hypothetical protein
MNAYEKIAHRIALIVTITLASLTMKGQLSRPGTPFPVQYKGLQYPATYEFVVSEEERSGINMHNSGLLKPARSGLLIDTDVSTDKDGVWHTLEDGTKVWRAAFHIKGATLLNLICKPYRLEAGVRMFLYDPSQQHILGAFTDLNNKSNSILATSYIPGETLIVEIQVPHYLSSPGSFTIANIGCDFSMDRIPKSYKDGWYGISGSCNEDINCPGNELYQEIKNAVVRIVYSGQERCTGTLINNANQDGKAYVLTAGHCIQSESIANSALFYFDYESPYCKGPDGNSSKSVSGATLRSRGSQLDFSLLELLEPVPFLYHPYFAGWDITTNVPSNSYSIHHPLGDVKKISKENDPVTVASFGTEFRQNTHWLVREWDTGTTEAGSSGGGLFDSDNRIRGNLTGGQALCGNSVNDYFQMISHSWKDSNLPESQLEYWLDPQQKGIKQVSGYDPYREFWESGDTLTNFQPTETYMEYPWGTWGHLSGHNSSHPTQFAEHFTSNQKDKGMGIILDVAGNYVASAASRCVIKIWQGDLLPESVTYKKEIKLADLVPGTGNFIEFDSIVHLGSSFYAGYELFYDQPADTFFTHMAANRESTDQRNTAFVFDSQWYTLNAFTGGQVYSSFSIFPVVFDSIPTERKDLDFTGNVIAYPNPASSILYVEFMELISSEVSIKISNMQGQIVSETNYGTYQKKIQLNTSNLSSGIYILTVRQGPEISNLKVFIFK